jgi:hypothetical protein
MSSVRSKLKRQLAKMEAWLRAWERGKPILAALREDPRNLFTHAGLSPDPWQEQLLTSPLRNTLLLCSRQAGKSTTAAALALRVALLRPGSPVLVLSPTLRQSGELFRKIAHQFTRLGRPVGVLRESVLQVEFANRSRILSLPGSEATVRGFSEVAMLIIDEAARVQDALYYAVRPMLAVSRGTLVALSTPFGKRGWFHDEWFGDGDWNRVRITANDCPRITKEFLAEERRALGERYFVQEYLCEFTDTIDAVFRWEDIQAAMSDEVEPLFAPATKSKPLFGK